MVNPDRNLYDPPYDDALLYDNELEPERPRSRSLVVMLAFVVLAAFAGVVWVAYNQGVQQGMHGINPPLLSADAGPTRIEPDQSAIPASNPAPEKSYERLWASNGERPASQDNVTPGSEQPRNDAVAQGSVPSTQEIASAAPPVKPAAKPKNDVPAVGGPMGDAPPVDPNMPNTMEMTGEVGQQPQFTPPSLSKNSDIPPMQPSETPAARPKVPAAPITQIQDAAPATAAEVPAATSGKFSIQLGSFPSDALAAAHWSKVKGANQDLLGSYSPQFVMANIPGKGTWFRLRVGGFADKSAAKAVCDQLSATGQACILAGK